MHHRREYEADVDRNMEKSVMNGPATSNLSRDIGTEDSKIGDIVKQLKEDKFLIPTFQREFVWLPANIIKLWDSILNFYPIGSILYWETDSYLHTHRKLGGFVFPHDEDTVRKFKDWKYILDGQQRATSLLVTLLGGKGRVEDNEEFDYTLYFDAVNRSFFFAGDLPKKLKTISRDFLIRLRDVPTWGFTFYKEIASKAGFTPVIESNLQELSRIFSDYKIPVVRIKGVEVNEVCEIFERINQEGKKLDPVDIIVARTYRTENPATQTPGFYLRDNLKDFKSVLIEQGNRFQDLDDLAIIQSIAICLRKEKKAGRQEFGITPAALDNLQTEDLERNWTRCQKTLFEVIKLLSDLNIKGPTMLPFGYLIFPLCHYFHENPKPDRDLARQWFWRTAFALEDFRSSTQVYDYCKDFFSPAESGNPVPFQPMTISRTKLIRSSYYYRNALSRAVMAFMAHQKPLDFSDPQAMVLDDVYLLMTQAPNLHHIYPQNFLKKIKDFQAGISPDSLMNICFIRAKTNIQIGDKNPLTYFQDFEGVRKFDNILQTHLIPKQFIERDTFVPGDFHEFLMARADWFSRLLVEELPDVPVSVTD
jgi:hypothetical protein